MVHKGKKAYLKKQKEEKQKSSKKAKIIVRNLPFKNLSENTVRDIFKEYGEIEEVNLLKKEDGKFVGCGFVQFKQVASAVKAISHANQKEVSGRKIIVDWALPKNTFIAKVQRLEEEYNQPKIKEEVLSEDEDEEGEAKYSIDTKRETWSSDSEESNEGDTQDDEDDGSESDFEDDDDDDDDEDEKKPIKKEHSDENQFKQKSNDVEEGKTVFVRNIPFSAGNEDLKECVETYGPVEYALICYDKLTEHSKGTGFVKFKDKESAAQCVKDSMKIFLHDNSLIVTFAVSKEKLDNKKESKKVIKDSRNLYLIREGTVIAGSKAAVGVSASDMAKRLQLEQWKNQILKDLNMFVSKTRLVIHNLPPNLDDRKLRELFSKHGNPNAIIKEAKVMYDKKKVDATGKGVSKEVGFVSFTKHEDALAALRNINNNPSIFTVKKRPIVAFSIENRSVINTKQKRIEKSRAKLGILDNDKQGKLSKLNRKQRRFIRRRQKIIEKRREAKKLKQGQTSEDVKVETNETSKRKRKNTDEVEPRKKTKVSHSAPGEEEPENSQFTGVISEPGKKIKLRSKFRLKNQANIHHQSLKKERRKRREREKKKMTVKKEPMGKKGKPKLMDDANLSKILSKHRENIQQSSVLKKWYDK